MEAKRELIEAVRERYRTAGRSEKKRILDEFAELAGYHRKHAVRVLKGLPKPAASSHRSERRVYDEAAVAALTIIWEAADRICGKRLKAVLATFVESMEKHGHLCLERGVRQRLLGMSADCTVDLFKPAASPLFGLIFHGLFQVLPNQFLATDNTYGCK